MAVPAQAVVTSAVLLGVCVPEVLLGDRRRDLSPGVGKLDDSSLDMHAERYGRARSLAGIAKSQISTRSDKGHPIGLTSGTPSSVRPRFSYEISLTIKCWAATFMSRRHCCRMFCS